MSLTAELVLPEDVLIIPVAELDPTLRAELADPESFALTRPLGRATSSLVGADVAELLAEFRSPTTVVVAVMRYSRRHELDPIVTLDQAYPALRQCLGEGFLVTPGTSAATEIVASLAPGTTWAGGAVVECVRVLDDTEVYRVELADGSPAALKLARDSGEAVNRTVRSAFVREAAVMQVIGGHPAPRLFDDGSAAERPHLLMEWCDGVPATGAARGDRPAVLRAVLAAYRQLDALGVRHGDIHPGNVLVDSAGAVRIIDFGLAAAPGVAGQVRRGGLQSYFEPEFAAALSARRRPPPPSPAGDVFALAALGYELITGSGWVELGLDSDEALRRIVEREPRPFRERGVHHHAELGKVLVAGLAKDPADRPASIAALADAVDAAIRLDAAGAVSRTGAGRNTRDRVVDDLVAQLLPGGALHRTDPAPPVASMSHGAAGIALGLLRIATLRADPDLLACADGWAERAAALSGRPDAFTSPELEEGEITIGASTPYHRESGVALVRALVAHAGGNVAARHSAVGDYLAAAPTEPVIADLTLGSGGALLGAALLVEAMRNDPYADLRVLHECGAATAEGVWRKLGSAGDVATSTTISTLGVAHGWAGLLLALLRWSAAVEEPVPDGFVDRLAELADLGQSTPDGLAWRWTNPAGTGASLMVPGWCNGTAGHVMLWTQAFRTLGDERYRELASRAGGQLAATAGGLPQLCCGAAGQAYALLDLYRITGEQSTLRAVHRLADRMAAQLGRGGSDDMEPASLYRGPLGAAVLLCELDRPELAAMPAFGLEGW